MKPRKILTSRWNRMEKGFQYSYINRRLKKRNFRNLWIVQINNAVFPLSYSRFIATLKSNNIILNRNMLANLAINENKIFKLLLKKIN